MVYPQRAPRVFLSRAQFEARIGLRPGALPEPGSFPCRGPLPPPDAIIGPVNKGWVAAQGHDSRLAAGNNRFLGIPFGCATATGRFLPTKSEK